MEPLAHAAVGLIAKPLAPKAPLWALLAATQVLDLLAFGFEAVGIEDFGVATLDFNQGLIISSMPFYPWSHGFFMSIVWSVVVAGIAFLLWRDRRTSIVIGLMVMSHWVLDSIVYSTLPLLFDNSQLLGIGLLNSRLGIIIGIILEIGLIAGGITAYFVMRRRATVKAIK